MIDTSTPVVCAGAKAPVYVPLRGWNRYVVTFIDYTREARRNEIRRINDIISGRAGITCRCRRCRTDITATSPPDA